MRLSKEQKFLYSRIAILIAFAGTAGFAFAGFNGSAHWYGGFVLCLWVALGLLNLPSKSSLFLARHEPVMFVLLYFLLVGSSVLVDQFGLTFHLWFYPAYQGAWLLWVWFMLYPFGALAALELVYFLGGFLGETLRFQEHAKTPWHRIVDALENALLLITAALIAFGAAGFPLKESANWRLFFLVAAGSAMLWAMAALVKLRFHIQHPGHYTLVLFVVAALAALSHEMPEPLAREWVSLEVPFFSALFLGLPLWAWLGWLCFILIPFRLWIYVALHPRIR